MKALHLVVLSGVVFMLLSNIIQSVRISSLIRLTTALDEGMKLDRQMMEQLRIHGKLLENYAFDQKEVR